MEVANNEGMVGRAVKNERSECVLRQIVGGDSRFSDVSYVADHSSLGQ